MINRNIIKNEVKVVVSISIFIMIFMICTSYIFLRSSTDYSNNFSLKDNLNTNSSNNEVIVTGENKAKVYNKESKSIEELDIEEYIMGVVSAEMQANFEIEALKAQAIAARTYYYAKRFENCKEANGAEICNSTHCQVYMTKEEILARWPENKREEYWSKINQAVNETKNQVLLYNNEIVKYPQFFSTSSGKTENAVDVFSEDIPYLKSTESLGEEISPRYNESLEISKDNFINKINSSYNGANLNLANLQESVNIISRTDGGSVKDIQLGSISISGTKFRSLFELNSANFILEFKENTIVISCKGYGHGVGMSQWGANIMASQGKKYDEILKHYYTGVDIGKVKFE